MLHPDLIVDDVLPYGPVIVCMGHFEAGESLGTTHVMSHNLHRTALGEFLLHVDEGPVDTLHRYVKAYDTWELIAQRDLVPGLVLTALRGSGPE